MGLKQGEVARRESAVPNTLHLQRLWHLMAQERHGEKVGSCTKPEAIYSSLSRPDFPNW